MRVHAATLEVPGVRLADVTILAWVDGEGRPRVQLDAAKVSVPALGWHDVGISLRGKPAPDGGSAWRFTGHVATRHAPGGALSDADVAILYDPGNGTLQIDLTQGKSSLTALLPLDQTSHLQLQLSALPLAWLRGLLAAAWPEARLNGGTATGSVAVDIAADGNRVSGRVKVAGAQLDTRQGTIAASGLGASGSFLIDVGAAATSVMFDGALRGGELLLGPLYARLPAHAANLHVSARIGPAGFGIDSLSFNDDGALRVDGSLAFDRNGVLEKLDFEHFAAIFPAAYDRYGTTLVQDLTGWSALQTSGSVTGSFDLDGGRFKAFDLTAQDLSLVNGEGSIAVSGLAGRLDWKASASRPETTLEWDALSLYRLAFGPATARLADINGALALREPVTVTLFGGGLQVTRLAWHPDAGKARRLSAAFSVTDVDLGALCKALGLPPFRGTLGGAVPDLGYHGDRLVFGGGLSLDVFGGSVSVTDLTMRDPFGMTPELAADIQIRQLDLAQLTGIFDFGSITGRLDGDIGGLALVDWKPVAFAASFAADGGGKISQHAIKSLTRVGGGGIAGGLEGMALRLFKSFGYSRLGLSCTLAKGVCTMGGITPDPNPDDDGFTIVEGSGLPRITVIGHQRSVDWATLVSRLRAASEGNGPVVR